jgi:hypothetical protein
MRPRVNRARFSRGRNALRPHWRGGVFGEIVEGGEIAVGDRVAFVG